MDGIYTGTGNVNVDFKNKAITVRSESGPQSCIIDCEGADNTRGFSFHSGETASSVLDGFTIQNGNNTGSYPYERGGGIYCISSSPTLINNIITGNTAINGGGFHISFSSPTLINNVITGNSANYGGGIYCYISSPTLTNTLIAKNAASRHGGGIYCYTSSPMLMNCTITGNAANWGGGFCCHVSSPLITNTILWYDTPQEIYLYPSGDPSTVTISYSNVEGGESGIVTNDNGTVDWLDSMYIYPLFVDKDNDDYHLTDYSPCIGAGTGSGAPSDDIEGNSRGTSPDMGAYENSRDEPLHSITITSPDGGEEIAGGSSYEITWNSEGEGIAHIHLQYSTDSGGSWQDIITDTADTGSYIWNPVPSIDSAQVRVKAIAEDTGGNELASDESDGDFTIQSPRIGVTPARLFFHTLPGGADPDDQILSITNTGCGMLFWTTADDADWLSLSPESGECEGETDDVTVSVDMAGLPEGRHNATITISAPGAVNTPQIVSITLMISVYQTYQMDLMMGWNLISLPLEPEDTHPYAVLASINTKYSSVWAYDPYAGWSVYMPGFPGEMLSMEPGRGYLIDMNEPRTLVIQGTNPGPESIFLEGEKWHLVGHNSLSSLPIGNIVLTMPNGTCIYTYDSEEERWLKYFKGAPGSLNDLELLEPGHGYWFYVEQDWTINY